MYDSNRLWRILIRYFAAVITSAIVGLALASFFGKFDAWLDLLSHFRLVFVAVLLILAVILIVLKSIQLGSLAGFALLVSAWSVLQLYIPTSLNHRPVSVNLPPATEAVSAKSIRILQINPQADKNHQIEKVLAYANQVDADVLVFTELSAEWKAALALNLKQYSYQVIASRYASGIAVFSKMPVEDTVILYFAGDPVEHPQVRCVVKTPAGAVRLIVAHPTVPKAKVASRNAELEAIGRAAAEAGSACVVVGDLNCSPWSYHFSKLLSLGKLRDSEQGFGPQCSWSTEVILPVVPIDHVLVGSNISVLKRSLGPNIGSDHLPVCVDLRINPVTNQ